MTAPVPLAPRTARPAQRLREAGIVAALRLGRNAGLVLGEHAGRLPRRARLAAPGEEAEGTARLIAWPQRQDGTVWHLAALHFPAHLPPPGVPISILQAGGPPILLGALPAAPSPAEVFAAAIASRAAERAGEIALFLADLAHAAPASGVLRTALRAFLAAASAEEGAIEVVGRSGGALVLQGWGRAPAADAEAILIERSVRRAPILAATYRRPDIPASATGVVHLIAEAAEAEESAPASLHIVDAGSLRRLPALPTRSALGPAETASHLRGLLPRLAGRPEALDALRTAARPAFAGVETVSRLGLPLAAALDVVVTVPGEGAYVMGWLLDPARHVAAVSLGAGQASARFDGAWARVARPDVTAGFRADARFAAAVAATDLHGFAAFVPFPAEAPADALHIAFDLVGGDVAFLPATPVAGPLRQRLRRAAASVDLFKTTGLGVVETALAPLVAAAARRPEAPAFTTHRAGPRAGTALLLALPQPEAPPAAMLSWLLSDPIDPASEALVVVVGPAWAGAPLAALEATLALHDIAATIVLADAEIELTEAWDIGARAAEAEHLVCLGGAGLAGPAGWRAALVRTLAEGAGVAVPLLVYEDGSTRSAGIAGIEPLAGPPFIRLRRPGVGLPARAEAAAPRPCLAAPLAGAAVSAEAYAAAGGFAASGMTAEAQELGFFLRLAAAGGRCHAVPSVAVVAPQSAAAAAPWREAARLADGAALRLELSRRAASGGQA